MGKRVAVFTYGLLSYLMFLGVFMYAVGFLGNLVVPKSVDSPRAGSMAAALLVNLGLLGLFALQHSVMARPAFKRWLTRLIPHAAERSTYVLATNLCLILLFWQWRPVGGVIWTVEHPLGRGLLLGAYAFGWMVVLVTTMLINHFDLFGLRQVWLYLRGREYTHLRFVTPGPYQWVRHPLYIGWLLAFWATTTMTATHLVFALGATAYILIAIQFEERDLIAFHGRAYAEYRKRVPMLIPRWSRRAQAGDGAVAGTA